MNKKGLIISFEGIEGVGKTTVIELITKRLNMNNIEYISSREPGGLPLAEGIREFIMNNELDAEKEALMFAAARCIHIKNKIEPALKEGKIVILDRYLMSSLCYQGYNKGLGVDKVYELNKYAIGEYTANLNILLDMDPEKSLNRVKNNNRETNRFDLESLEFHKKNRVGYLSLANRFENEFAIINADQSLEKVVEDIIETLNTRLNLNIK